MPSRRFVKDFLVGCGAPMGKALGLHRLLSEVSLVCGIAGMCSLGGSGVVSREALGRMLGAMRHRGPDESGVYLDGRVGLGHNRLSIIDLSGGTQPIPNEDGSLWVVFNGEIFNYLELRRDLLARGHVFATATDTEVIVHLYEEMGPRCVGHLNGQFALALWDRREQALLLARDRVGIRPLHYTFQKGHMLFASEIKALFALQEVPRAIDPVAMDQIFTFWTTLRGRTAFRDVFELPPGHTLSVSNGKVALERYWDIPFQPCRAAGETPVEEVCSELRGLVEDAVRIRLRADVPVGCYVSGGLDSSAIAALVKREVPDRLRTFGITFEDLRFDEGGQQREIVGFLKTDHTAMHASDAAIGEHFAKVIWHCEKPLLRTAPVPLFLLSRLVRESGFKVVLTGEGADEVFGGYNIFKEMKVRRFWARQPQSVCRPLLIGRLYPYIFRNPAARQALQAFFGKELDDTGDPLFSHRIRWQNTGRIKMFLSDALKAEAAGYDGMEELRRVLPAPFQAWDGLSRAQYLEMTVFMSNYLLSSQGDRVAMAHAVEARMPFLDHRVIEFMGRVPAVWKMPGLQEKVLLRRAFRGILPERTLQRPKQPYRAPICGCLLRHRVESNREALSQPAIQEAGLFDPVKVGKLLKKLGASPEAGEVDSMALAGVLSAQLLHHQFVARFHDYCAGEEAPLKRVIDLRSNPDHVEGAHPTGCAWPLKRR